MDEECLQWDRCSFSYSYPRQNCYLGTQGRAVGMANEEERRTTKVRDMGADGGLFRSCMDAMKGGHSTGQALRHASLAAGLLTDARCYAELLGQFYLATAALEQRLQQQAVKQLPLDKMLALLQQRAGPGAGAKGGGGQLNIAVQSGRGGACFSHDHDTHYSFVTQVSAGLTVAAVSLSPYHLYG